MAEELTKNLLDTAKALVANNEFESALACLKKISDLSSDYVVINKAAKIASKIAPKCGLKKIKAALLSSSTTTFLIPIIKFYCNLENIDLDIEAGDFGNWRQDIINQESWLKDFSPDIVIIATNYRDCAFNGVSQDPQKKSDEVADEIALLWDTIKLRNSKAAIIHLNFDLPEYDSGGLLSHTSQSSRCQVLKLASLKLLQAAQERSLALIDQQLLQIQCGATWFDNRLWHHAKQHPSLSSLPIYAKTIARAIKAKYFPPKKVCVLDLDNTLWGGIIGEDLIGGIKLGAPDAKGEAYVEFQNYLLELKYRGILLAVCSKNNEEDAKIPFQKHPSMAIKLDDIVSFKANWQTKSQNISEIAKELNLGLDSFIFIDDNPAEIQQVQSTLPQVKCVQLPEDPADFIATLDSNNFFDVLEISSDDISRNRTYKENKARENAKASAVNMEDFLKSLNMQCDIEDIDSTNIARVAQLLSKTNQFNLTTRRHSAEKINELLSQKNSFGKCFRLKDKFGDNGVVGIIIAVQNPNGSLEIDSFVMSCRVIGRGLENLMCNEIFKFAKSKEIKNITGIYIPTEKNSQTKDIYLKLGFEKVSVESSAEDIFLKDTDSYAQQITFISTSK